MENANALLGPKWEEVFQKSVREFPQRQKLLSKWKTDVEGLCARHPELHKAMKQALRSVNSVCFDEFLEHLLEHVLDRASEQHRSRRRRK